MNKEVSFNIAKLLKEKGYNLPCKKYYPDDSNLLSTNRGSIRHKAYRINTPTIAEVVMWLYEKHGVWITVNWYNYNNNSIFWSYTIEKIVSYPKPIDYTPKKTTNCSEPIAAYEAAIEYTLNNLI